MIKDVKSITSKYVALDMHTHTQYSHDCSTNLKVFGEILKTNDLGVSVTDHNEIKGVYYLKKLFPELLIIPGIEVTSINSKDLLFYFERYSELEEFYKRHIEPNKKLTRRTNKTTLSTKYVLDIATDYNALSVLPHPFMRLKGSARDVKKDLSLLKNVKGVEVFNASKSFKDNKKSLEFANKYDLPRTGGSDSHIKSTLGNALTLTTQDNIADIFSEILKKNVKIVGYPDGIGSTIKGFGTIFKNKIVKKKL